MPAARSARRKQRADAIAEHRDIERLLDHRDTDTADHLKLAARRRVAADEQDRNIRGAPVAQRLGPS